MTNLLKYTSLFGLLVCAVVHLVSFFITGTFPIALFILLNLFCVALLFPLKNLYKSRKYPINWLKSLFSKPVRWCFVGAILLFIYYAITLFYNINAVSSGFLSGPMMREFSAFWMLYFCVSAMQYAILARQDELDR